MKYKVMILVENCETKEKKAYERSIDFDVGTSGVAQGERRLLHTQVRQQLARFAIDDAIAEVVERLP